MAPEVEYIELSNYSEGSRNKDDSGWTLSPTEIKHIFDRLGLIGENELTNDEDVNNCISKKAQYMISKIDSIPIAEAVRILRETLVEHKSDVNFLQSDYRTIERLVATIPGDFESRESSKGIKHENKDNSYADDLETVNDNWDLNVRIEASLIAYHSPYPEIRTITDPVDDPNIPVETLRAYVIGFFWTIIGSIINNFFMHRLPSISLNTHTIQVLLLPSGRLWERFVPQRKVRVMGMVIDLNPGPWTYKEMMLCTIIYSCSAGTPYSIYNVVVMKLDKFYGLKWVSWTYQLLLTLSTQFLGFGFALVMRKICIYPSKAIWPTVLPTIALNRALMDEEPNYRVHGWKISRYSFFIVVFVGSFCYNWLPSYLFTTLSTFNWPTWFNSNSIHLVNITGSNSGLGLNPLPTFDWNIIDSLGCLTLPFYAYANQYIGTLLGFSAIVGVYYSNMKWTAYLPINSNKLFNNKGEVYNIHDILGDKNGFDSKKYNDVGPPYFSAANLVVYAAYFTLYPFAILYHVLTEWESTRSAIVNIYYLCKDAFSPKSKKDTFGRYKNDPHCKMMSAYDEVPDWWFISVLLASVVLALICVGFYPTETPIWGIFFTIAINFIFLIPITSIASVTGFSFGLNVLVELIVGYAIPNSGLALITLKSYGYNIDSQASSYITDQKLAHYAKVPPKAIFKGQTISTLMSVVIALLIANWQIDNVKDLCESSQRNKLSCPGANTYFYSSVQYGEIGPAKVFSGLYPILKWNFLLGAVLVVPCYWFKKHGPPKFTRYFQPTIIIGGFLLFAPYNLSYYTCGLYVSFIFMYHIKNHYLLWWEKYNYILTSALSAGVAFSALVIFFTVSYNSDPPEWWGNSLNEQGIEGSYGHAAWLDAKDAPDGYIGLRKGHFP